MLFKKYVLILKVFEKEKKIMVFLYQSDSEKNLTIFHYFTYLFQYNIYKKYICVPYLYTVDKNTVLL